MNRKRTKFIFPIISIVFGIAIAAFLAPKGKFFWGNFVYYWGPHASLFLLTIVLRFRVGVLTGTAIILAIYLFAFHSWAFSLPRPESLLWLLYLFSFIGAGVGVLFAGIYCNRNHNLSNLQTTGISAMTTITGLILSLFIENQIFI